jgi:hypothetical protein
MTPENETHFWLGYLIALILSVCVILLCWFAQPVRAQSKIATSDPIKLGPADMIGIHIVVKGDYGKIKESPLYITLPYPSNGKPDLKVTIDPTNGKPRSDVPLISFKGGTKVGCLIQYNDLCIIRGTKLEVWR